MNDNAKCFLLDGQNGYAEITFADLKRLREQDEQFRLRRFIELHGMLLEVTENFIPEPSNTFLSAAWTHRKQGEPQKRVRDDGMGLSDHTKSFDGGAATRRATTGRKHNDTRTQPQAER